MKKPHLLITRPIKDADLLKKKLQALGYKVTLEPVIKILPAANAAKKIQKALQRTPQAIIITSRNALRILHASKVEKNIPLFIIGAATTLLAKQWGFGKATKAGDTADQLYEYVIKKLSAHSGTIFYLAGKNTAKDIAGRLRKKGFTVKKTIIYDAVAIKNFSSSVLKSLAVRQIDGILFLSTRSAEIFCALAARAKLQPVINNMHLFCLSANIANVFVQANKCYVSSMATEDALVRHIRKILPP